MAQMGLDGGAAAPAAVLSCGRVGCASAAASSERRQLSCAARRGAAVSGKRPGRRWRLRRPIHLQGQLYQTFVSVHTLFLVWGRTTLLHVH
eukprot:366367-Chlamydomonas_euryale.AAC.8